jgi:AcrR family transcriptional regulator
MAWDTEGTKRRLLAAAVDEFSRWGLAGARIDRIAATAGVNKERIYQYFGGKAAFFDIVVLAELDRLAEAVPLDATSPGALVDYAGAVFDHYQQRPHLARLLHWEGLERGHDLGADQTQRADRYRAKVAVITQCLPETATAHQRPGDVLLTMIALATSWHVLPQLNRMILNGHEHDVQQRRNALTWSVRQIIGA